MQHAKGTYTRFKPLIFDFLSIYIICVFLRLQSSGFSRITNLDCIV